MAPRILALLLCSLGALLPGCASMSAFRCDSLTDGIDQMNAGNYERAVSCFDGYLARYGDTDPPSRVITAYADRGWVHQTAGHYDLALADYNEWLRRDPQPNVALLARAAVHLQLKNYDFAIADYRTVLKTAPGSTAALLGLGEASRARHRYADAERFTSYAIAVDASPASLLARARVYAAMGNAGKEMADLDRMVELFPQRPEAFLWRGIARLEEHAYAPAIDDFTKALELSPRWPDALSARGAAYAASADYRAALADLDRAIELSPKTTRMARMNRSRVYFAQGAPDRAIAEIEAAIELFPDWPDARVLDGLYLSTQDRMQDAHWALFRAAELADDDASIQNTVGWILATDAHDALRDGKLALKYATRACELSDWGDANDIDTLAAAHAEAGQFDEAVRRQRKAIEILKDLMPDRPDLAGYQERLALYEARKPYRQADGPRSPRLPISDPPGL